MAAAEAATGTRRNQARRGEGERLRAELIAATEGLLVETGDPDALSIRSIAAEVGCTPASIYLHFAEKQQLVVAVCERLFTELDDLSGGAALEALRDGDEVDAIAAMGRAYVRFGLERPEAYRVLFMTPGRFPTEQPDPAAGLPPVFQHLVDSVERATDAGLVAGDPFVVACGLWAVVHGLTSLLIGMPAFPFPDTDEYVDHVIDLHCRALRRVTVARP